MKNRIILTLISVLILIVPLSATKYAGEIFQMRAGVRNFAMGGCGVADHKSFALAYWNPSLLKLVEENRFELMHAEEYMGLLKYDTVSAIWGTKTKMSLVLTRIGINDIPLTKLQDPNEPVSYSNRPYKYKSVNNSDYVLYFGFPRRLAGINFGFTVKAAYRHLAEENGFGFGADLSAYHNFTDRFMIAARLRDFFTTQILWGNGTHEIVYPGLDLEGNYRLSIPYINEIEFLMGLEIYSESREEASLVAVGPLSFDIHGGFEMNVHPKITLYTGYDIDNLTAGLSIKFKNWLINYSFEQVPELENSHRISVGFIL
jgi:hypothetical protein